MAMRRVFVLMNWLFCIHVTTVLAATPQQKHAWKHSLAQSRNRAIAPPITPQVAGDASPHTTAQQAPTPTAAAQDATKQRRYIAEEMVMQQAWIYSAVLPGWGQVYNEHYWKVPAIYAGFAGLGWGAIYYHKEYINYKAELIQKKRPNNLNNYVNECRMGRDLCIIFAALWYVVNIFDAYVGSSLKTFTLSDDISMEVQPSVLPTVQNKPNVGLSLTLSFGK
jgi:hypothetical protein